MSVLCVWASVKLKADFALQVCARQKLRGNHQWHHRLRFYLLPARAFVRPSSTLLLHLPHQVTSSLLAMSLTASFQRFNDPACVFRIEMSSSASPEAACQLDSRYWKITTSDGNVEEVQGPGVVGTLPASHLGCSTVIGWDQLLNVCVCVCICAGEFPVMTPGKVHEYASCTTFSTSSEYMEGHYTFHRLGNYLHL